MLQVYAVWADWDYELNFSISRVSIYISYYVILVWFNPLLI